MNENTENVSSTDNAELLRQILDTTKKQARYSRLAMIFTGGVFAVMAVMAIMIVPGVVTALEGANRTIIQAESAVNEANTTLQQVQTMTGSITNTSENVNSMVTDNSAALTDAVQKLSEIDFDGLNTAIGDLQNAVGPLSRMVSVFR